MGVKGHVSVLLKPPCDALVNRMQDEYINFALNKLLCLLKFTFLTFHWGKNF